MALEFFNSGCTFGQRPLRVQSYTSYLNSELCFRLCISGMAIDGFSWRLNEILCADYSAIISITALASWFQKKSCLLIRTTWGSLKSFQSSGQLNPVSEGGTYQSAFFELPRCFRFADKFGNRGSLNQ